MQVLEQILEEIGLEVVSYLEDDDQKLISVTIDTWSDMHTFTCACEQSPDQCPIHNKYAATKAVEELLNRNSNQ